MIRIHFGTYWPNIVKVEIRLTNLEAPKDLNYQNFNKIDTEDFQMLTE